MTGCVNATCMICLPPHVVIRTASGTDNNCNALITSLTDSDIILAKAQFGGDLRGAVYFVSVVVRMVFL